MVKNVKIVIIQDFESKFYQYFIFTKKLLHRFVSFCISLILSLRVAYLWKKRLVTIKLFLLDFFGGREVKMCDKMAISAYTLKIVEKDPFLRLQRRAKETFNRHQFFSTNK